MTEKASPNDFTRWRAACGYNGSEIRRAAAEIGVEKPTTASEISTGKRPLTKTERLAMSAVRAGLEPWTPENDEISRGIGQFRQMIETLANAKASLMRVGRELAEGRANESAPPPS